MNFQGIQTFNEDGSIRLDIGNNVFVLHGVLTTNNQGGQLTIDRSLGRPFFVINNPYFQESYSRPTVTLNESTGLLSWDAAQTVITIFYGTY